MYLQLIREKFTKKSTIGKLFINGVFECYTLEDKDRFLEEGGEKVYGKTAIPRGIYTIEFRFSPHFNRILPHLIDVNGFTYVMIHWGNYAEDTDGCILVGSTEGVDFIGHSRDAFEALMGKLLEEDGIITIEIV
jgi:hypothetical protein